MPSDAGETPSAADPVDVIVVVRPEVGRALRDDSGSSPEAQALLAAAEEVAVVLAPADSGADDDSSASYYRFEARDEADARRVVEALRATDAVVAAYRKPPATPPS
jgi:hypothetical protein